MKALRREGRDAITFLPGVADRLVVLGPLLRPLIELHWTRDVARWTGVAIEDDRLHTHLFGAERTSFPRALRDGLAELQGALLLLRSTVAPPVGGRSLPCVVTLAQRCGGEPRRGRPLQRHEE